jgi:uroporphyrinogen-III decarboxylase
MGVTPRERFLATMRYQPVDRCPLWEWHYLEDTVERWRSEGLPPNVALSAESAAHPATAAGGLRDEPISVARYFDLDPGQPYCQGTLAYVPVNTGMLPPFPLQILEEDERTQLLVDEEGVTKQILKHIVPAMPRFLDFPVKTREDWASMKLRYGPAAPERYPEAADWAAFKADTAERDCPVGLIFDGYFGRLRRWMGLEGLLYTLYDDPKLIEEMCEFHTEFILQTIERGLREVEVDYANIWEDMAYKNGPLMSPRHVRQYMLPGYTRIVDLLHKYGVDVIFVDSDGNLDLLIPIWLEAGINGVWPLEVAAGMDARALREQYGRDLLLVGGIDKRELSKGREQVCAEVMRQVPYLIESGGYIPTVDHSVPPDVPLENYVYFRELLADLALAPYAKD